MLRRLTSALIAVLMLISLCGCTPKPGEWKLSEYMEIMETESPQVAAMFPSIADKSPLIVDKYITYDMGQYIAYLQADYTDADGEVTFSSEKARIEALVNSAEYKADAVVDTELVPGATKYTLMYSRAVEAYMFGSGLYTFALVYEEDERIVYVAVSENPEYTYAQFIPEPYYIIEDLHASAKAQAAAEEMAQ